VTELERFFRQIVRNLNASDPSRLHRPLSLADIRDHIVPYRTNRRALELESSEDYELVLLRLCAGEGGFARTEPDEVRAEFEAELRNAYPDLGIVHRYGDAVVCLEAKLLGRALDPKPELAFAPPELVQLHEAEAPLPSLPELQPIEFEEARDEEERGSARCTQCRGILPTGRTVNFCPHCGRSQVLTRCPVCESELETGWRHCVSCGYLIGDG
jgi:double zinc ribbon protein